jgi:hypothetical protein
MTHMSNYGNDRLALYTFEAATKFLQCWTNLQFQSISALQLADKYFRMYPEESEPVWGVRRDTSHIIFKNLFILMFANRILVTINVIWKSGRKIKPAISCQGFWFWDLKKLVPLPCTPFFPCIQQLLAIIPVLKLSKKSNSSMGKTIIKVSHGK